MAMGQYDSFVLRVWRRVANDGEWVGRLEHLQERDNRTFHDVDLLLVHLRATISPTGTHAVAEPMMVLKWVPHSKPDRTAVEDRTEDAAAADGAIPAPTLVP